jgi:hypothetical protein
MNQQASNRDLRANGQASKPTAKPTAKPAFKPVALPAVAAAVRAAKLQPSRPKASQPPAILRKEAVLG